MDNQYIQNAVIESTMLGFEDHGIFTCTLNLQASPFSYGFGGYAFDKYDTTLKRRFGHAFGIDCISAILKIANVDRWEKLPGKYIRVKHEDDSRMSRIVAIGHIIEDNWFNIQDLAKEHFGNE